MKIGIIGFGYVGQAVYGNIKDKTRVLINDVYKTVSNNTSVDVMKKQCDVIFVCVNTPENDDGSVDTSSILDVLHKLIDYKGLVIVKSTIPSHFIPIRSNLVINPEFLNQISSIEDFRNQKYIILGGAVNDTFEAEHIYNKYFHFFSKPKYEHCTTKEASDFKYMRNVKQAYNVMYWEYVQDITNNSRKMSKMMKYLPVQENDIVGMDGIRGFDGACLPKDVSAMEQEKPHLLTRFLINFNRVLKA